MDRCPKCNEPIVFVGTWKAEGAIFRLVCDDCGATIREVPAEKIAAKLDPEFIS